MKLDQTRYKAFNENPERYRLTYQLNLVPITIPFALQRGIAFHAYRMCKFLGWTDAQYNEMLSKEGVNDPRARQSAVYLAEKSLEVPNDRTVEAVEVTWEYRIPDTEHTMCGRIDELEVLDGVYDYGEWKTTGEKLTRSFAERLWRYDDQAGFGILGLYALGKSPTIGGLARIKYIQEKQPPIVWSPIEVSRSVARQQQLITSVAATCDAIEGLIATRGVDEPWTHLWPFWCAKEEGCEYSSICSTRLGEADTSNFTERREHLECMLYD